MEMADYDRMDLTENSSSERSYIPIIGRITHHNRSRICIIILAVLAVAFFLGFVVVISEHACNDKQEGVGSLTAEEMKLKDDLDRKTKAVNDLTEKSNGLTKSLEEKTVAINDLTTRNNELTASLQKKTNAINDLTTRNNELTASLQKKTNDFNNQIADLTDQLHTANNKTTELGNEIQSLTSCVTPEGVKPLKIMPERKNDGPIPVFQRYASMDGDWLVFQRRQDGSVDFARKWTEYVDGFGTPCGEYWLGLETIYQLTKNGDQKLRIDMIENGTGIHYRAEYSNFTISPASDKYRLTLAGYTGNATDVMLNTNAVNVASGQRFSTIDADHDTSVGYNCATESGGGWWHASCSYPRLNGKYDGRGWYGFIWATDEGIIHLKFAEMKIKRN